MKRWMIGLLMTALVLSYQNCGVPQSGAPGADENSLKSDYNSADWTSVEFSSAQAGERASGMYRIDTATGEISSLSNDYSKVAETKKCLSDDELTELQDILATSSVCEPQEKADPSRTCTMEFIEAYAYLVSDKGRAEDVVALGEKANGCVIPTDLCGDHSNLLKGFLASIRNSLDQRSCAE